MILINGFKNTHYKIVYTRFWFVLGNARRFKHTKPNIALNATLTAYQEKGVYWMIERLERYNGCLLADDMGMGKTIQTIAVILYYLDKKKITLKNKALIIVPKVLIDNWRNEFKKFAPEISPKIWGENEYNNSPIVLITYDNALKNITQLGVEKYFLLILDEAQYIKTTTAKRSQKIKTLTATKRLALTATPMENRFEELLNILDFLKLCPEKVLVYLEKLWCITKEHKKLKNIARGYFEKYIQKAFKYCILRREKNDSMLNLPKMKINTIRCDLTKEQKQEYNKKMKSDKDYKAILSQGHFQLFSYLQLTCNTSNLHKTITSENSIKISKTLDIIKNMKLDDKMLIFTHRSKSLTDLKKIISYTFNIKCVSIQGCDTPLKRLEAQNRFNNSPEHRIFLISKKTAGIGLNLTAANKVIIFEPWWNSAVDNQAIARAHRIGQTRKVDVFKFKLRDTLEPSIIKLCQDKEKAITQIITSLKIKKDADYTATYDTHHQKQLLDNLVTQILPMYQTTEMYTWRLKMVRKYIRFNNLKNYMKNFLSEDEIDEIRKIITQAKQEDALRHLETT